MRIYELFKTEIQPAEPLHQLSGGAWGAVWRDGDVDYHISFSPVQTYGGKCFEVAFGPEGQDSNFDSMTDFLGRAKSAASVFKHVIGFIRQFMQQARPTGVLFSAYEPRRLALYNRMIKYLQKDIQSSGYTIITIQNGVGIIQKNSRAYFTYQAKRLGNRFGLTSGN